MIKDLDVKLSVAIFGGSFDPPHIGHLEIIKKALDSLPIEKLYVIPAFISPFKEGHFAPTNLRLRWLERITAFDKRVEVSDIEIKKEKKSYSIDTVNHFASLYDTIFFIIGADNLKTLHKWHKFDELDKKVKWVVATRNGVEIPDIYVKLEIDKPVSSSYLRVELDLKQIPDEIQNEVLEFYKSTSKKGVVLNENIELRVERIVKLLDAKKTKDLQTFDLRDKEYLTDFVVIATTIGEKHTLALLDMLKEELKPKGEKFFAVDEGDQWTVIDLGDILIHLMVPEYRTKYNLEEFLEELGKIDQEEG